MEIKAYTKELEPEVRAFNQRLRTGGVAEWQLPGSHRPRFPMVDSRSPYQEFFLTVHRGVVHGGYILTHRRFSLRGEIVPVACGPQLNLSEGLIDQRYSMIGVIQLQEALREHPLMFGLGMAGTDGPLSRLFAASGWSVFSVPMMFRVGSASRFVDNISYLRRRPATRVALDVLRWTPLPSTSIRLLQLRLRRDDPDVVAQSFSEFGQWANAIWNTCHNRYSLAAEREFDSLNILYPTSESRFLRLRVSRGDKDLGWAVTLAPRLSGHQYFGNMHVGSIVDCLAAPEDAYSVVQQATKFLEEQGVDMIISTQASSAWRKALSDNGYLSGPSNVALALSPCLVERLQPLDKLRQEIHINRGDGEGPTIL